MIGNTRPIGPTRATRKKVPITAVWHPPVRATRNGAAFPRFVLPGASGVYLPGTRTLIVGAVKRQPLSFPALRGSVAAPRQR